MQAVKRFGAFLTTLVRRYGGTKRDLAHRIGVSPSRFSRLLTAEAAPTIELCLNLADATGTSPLVVLRSARFGRVADQLERLFGPAVDQQGCYPLTPIECQHVDQWRALAARERKAFTIIIEASLEVARRVPVVRPPRPHAPVRIEASLEAARRVPVVRPSRPHAPARSA
jgi:transcriptional regulator with XRE-family HTH domain